jgi:hypothetical protein
MSLITLSRFCVTSDEWEEMLLINRLHKKALPLIQFSRWTLNRELDPFEHENLTQEVVDQVSDNNVRAGLPLLYLPNGTRGVFERVRFVRVMG